MTIVIITDIEGICGVDDFSQVHCRESDGWKYACRRLMADTNAAIDGAFRAGADKVYVVDGHAGGGNFVPGMLDGRAVQISGTEFATVFSEEKIDACLEVGAHAKPGTKGAFLEHVQSSKNWFSYRVNGCEYGEIVQAALYAGAFGVPFVMVSGDDALCREARECFGNNIACAEVKKGISWKEAQSVDEELARKLISEAAEDGIRRRNEMEPFKPDLPLNIEVTFVRADICEEHHMKYPDLERTDSRTLKRVVEKIESYFDVLLGRG